MTSSTAASSVHFVTSVGNTEIAECSFFDCNGTSSLGGTVYVKLDSSIEYSAKCSSCVFVRCRGQPTNGAALEFDRAMPYTVSDCVFYQTESTDKGAAIILSNTQSCPSKSTVFNSIFESSFSGNVYSGAALYMSLCDNFLFSSLRFVDTHADTPREIVHSHFSLKFSATNLQNCQSSRSSLTCGILWIYSGTPTSQEGLISPITKETFVKAFSGKASQAGKATFEIEVGDAVTGEMVVVVENLEYTRSSPPPITRSLTFSFSAAKTASCTVAVGDTELIQSPVTEYKLRRAAVADWLVHTLRVKSRTVSFTDQTKTQIVLSLDCNGLVRDGYSILVKTGSTEQNISLTLQSDQKTYTATGSISTNAESVFMFATEYDIMAVKDEWGRALIVPSAVTFRTPDEPGRLIKMTHDGFDSTGEHLIVRVRGQRMPVGTYSITLTPGSESFDVVFGELKEGETLEERDSEPFPIRIYGENKKILFDTSYTISTAFDASDSPIMVSPSETEMTTPSEPARITAITKVEYLDANKTIELSWEGRVMKNGPYTVTLSVNGSSTATATLTLPFDSSESTSTTTETLFKSALNGLKYSTTYVVTDVRDKSNAKVFYNSDITFTTITEPTRLLSISSQVNCTNLNTTTLTLTGHQVAAGDATLTVVLSSVVAGSETDSDKINLAASFTRSGDESTGTVLIPLYPTPKLAYGKTYRIVSLSSADYIGTTLTFTTPSQPGRIKAVEPLTYSEFETEVTITVTGVHCPSADVIITLRKDGTSEETNLTFTCVSDQKFECTATVWSATGTVELVEGATYTLMKTGTSGVFVDSGLKVAIGAGSSRIVSLGAFTDGDDLNTTRIAVLGEKMSAGTYTLRFLDSTQFQATGDENFVETEIVFTSATEGSMLINLYPTAQLIYGHTYSIKSFTKPESVSSKVINHITTLTAPTEPSRLERIAEVNYLDANKTIELRWEGRVMKNGPYTVTLSVNGSSTATTTLTLPFDSSESTSATTETLFKSALNGLKYSTTYVVTGVKDQSDKPVFYNSGMTFTTIAEPTRLLSIFSQVNCTDLNTTTLTLIGHQVSAGDATLTVVLSSVVAGSETDSAKITLAASFTRSGDESTGTVLIPLYPTPKLAYGKTYRIVSLSSADYIDTTLTFKTPAAPPRITSINKLTYNELFTEVTVHFEGIDFSTVLTCTLTFKDVVDTSNTDPFEVSFRSDQTGSGTLEMWNADGTSKVKQGKTYEIIGASSAEDASLVFNSGMQFKVTDPLARIVAVGTAINGADLNTTTIPFVGENMPSGTYFVSMTDTTISSDSGETVIINAEIVFTSATEGTMMINLYPTAQLIYGHTYSIKSFTKPESVSSKVINHITTLTAPTEPSRLEGVTPVLSDDEKNVILKFDGRAFDAGVYELSLQPGASNAEIVVPLDRNEDGTLSCSISTDSTLTPHVVFGAVYTISQITKDSAPIIINPKAKQFTVPFSPILKSISFEFTNSPCTSFKLVLTAEHVNIGRTYTLKLDTGETFTVIFSTPEKGETGFHRIGWSDTIQYGTEYTVAELRAESSVHPMRKQVDTFTTFKKPRSITLIADGLNHNYVIIKVLKETTETQPISIPNDVSVMIENGKVANGIIRIPASATHPDGSGLITVNEGTMELKKVEVAVETASESFVFLCGVNSTIVLENCVIDGVNIPVPNSDTLSICEWTSGVIELDNCSTTIDWSKFHELPQGALNMKGGTITIDSSVFRDNTPNTELFPSARRNIVCSNEGEVAIGTLSSGDGTHDTPSAWMSLGDCHLNSKSMDGTKLLFIPTLDSNKTKSTSTSHSYDVSLFGSLLMPCGLGLEVVEWDEKEKVEKRSTTIELAGLNSSEWSETSVNLKLNRSSIKDIDHSLELHARLAFGQNQSTANHILLKISDAAAKKALTLEQTKKTLMWLIPVIASVVLFIFVLIIVVLCRRRKQRKAAKDSLLIVPRPSRTCSSSRTTGRYVKDTSLFDCKIQVVGMNAIGDLVEHAIPEVNRFHLIERNERYKHPKTFILQKGRRMRDSCGNTNFYSTLAYRNEEIIMQLESIVVLPDEQVRPNRRTINQELDQQDPIDVEKMDEQEARIVELNAGHTNNMLHHNVPTTIGSDAMTRKGYPTTVDSLNNSGRGQSETRMGVRCGEELVEVPVNVNDTLYNRLHKGGQPLDTPLVFRMITQGLAQIAKHNPKMPILTNLSPLWVYLDEQDMPIFQNKDDRVPTQTNIPESSFFPGSEHKPVNQTPSAANPSFHTQSLNGQSSNRHSEGQRWLAPEVADKKVEIDTTKAADKGLWMFVSLIPLNKMESVHFRNGMLNKISNGIHPNYLDLGMMSNKESGLVGELSATAGDRIAATDELVDERVED
ncbi:hypothetical protein BLNAU_15713 [Blattamonas nauphoetae]|uniref:Uncharacterized protein n=1 Tax=Blattamonas nauphoetae TaxID=2049346 RepID=A0ABQ9XA37_9EUKA|nr:hypothetical protein BLNAU_15713 [Blattamonas nauphoetae]